MRKRVYKSRPECPRCGSGAMAGIKDTKTTNSHGNGYIDRLKKAHAASFQPMYSDGSYMPSCVRG